MDLVRHDDEGQPAQQSNRGAYVRHGIGGAGDEPDEDRQTDGSAEDAEKQPHRNSQETAFQKNPANVAA
jgi:hypothetical protein